MIQKHQYYLHNSAVKLNLYYRLVILFLIVFIGAIHSCEYEPKGSFERETIVDNPFPTLQSVNLDLMVDTLYIYTTNIFMYDFASSNEIISVRFTLDNEEQYVSNSACSSFQFRKGSLSEGIHTLVAELFVEPGTQSIADIVGEEVCLLTKTWILKVDKSYHSQTYAYVSDGYLKLSWPKYMASDFINYSIYRLGWPNPPTLINQQISSEFTDSSYVGEGGIYLIKVNLKNHSELDWGRIDLVNEIPVPEVSIMEGNQYFLTWRKSKYYNGVDTFMIIDDMYVPNKNVLKATQDPDDTTYHIATAFFGDYVTFYLHLVPKKYNNNYSPQNHFQYTSSNQTTCLGYPLISTQYQKLHYIKQINDKELVFIQNDYSLVRYSTATRKVMEEKGFKLCAGSYNMELGASPMKKYISTYHSCDNLFLVINPTNFNESTIYDITNVKPFSRTTVPVLSDNKILVTNYLYNSFIYDLNNSELLATYTSNSNFSTKCLAISSNGDYMFLQDDFFRLIKFNNPNFENVWINQNGYYNPPKYYEFHSLNPEQLALWDGLNFYIKKCSDFSTVYEFPLTDLNLLNVDYCYDKILSYNEGHILVRSLLNGELLQDIPVNFKAGGGTKAVFLINNVIIHQNGVMYYLD